MALRAQLFGVLALLATCAASSSILCVVEGTTIACYATLTIATSNNVSTLAIDATVLLQGEDVSIFVKENQWPTCSFTGESGYTYKNGFHAQTAGLQCLTNCCPTETGLVSNFLSSNGTVAYFCGATSSIATSAGTVVAVNVVFSAGGTGVTLSASTAPVVAPTVNTSLYICLPMQQETFTPSELQFLTPPFLVPSLYFGAAIHHIGMTQLSFIDSFNCSQPRGSLTALVPDAITTSLYDQFAPFRTTNQLTHLFSSSTAQALYVGSTYNSTTGFLQSVVRIIGPLHVLLDREMGVPRPLILVAPLLAAVHVAAAGPCVVLQLVPSYRAPTPTISTLLTIGCLPSDVHLDNCLSLTFEQARGDEVGSGACVALRPMSLPWNSSWSVSSNSTFAVVHPQHPLMVAIPRGHQANLTCVLNIQSPSSGTPFMTIRVGSVQTTDPTTSSDALLTHLPTDWSLLRRIVAVWHSCTLSLDEAPAAFNCTPLSNAACMMRYGGARPQYDANMRRCAPTPMISSLLQPLLSLSDNITPTPASTAATPTTAFPWMTAAWRRSINTSSVCGAHGVWNETTWWCDCSSGWGTDYTQDPWAASTYTWCSTPLQWLTSSPGAWEGGSNRGVMSFITAWIERFGEGDLKTVLITMIGFVVCLMLVALLLQGAWIVAGPPQAKKVRQRKHHRKHRRRRVRTERLIEGPPGAPLQIMWHRGDTDTSPTSSSSQNSHARVRVASATREEIEMESASSSFRCDDDTSDPDPSTERSTRDDRFRKRNG